MSNWTHGSSEETDWRRAAADHFIKVYDLDNDDEERTEGMIAGFAAIIDWYMADAKIALEPVEYPSSPEQVLCSACGEKMTWIPAKVAGGYWWCALHPEAQPAIPVGSEVKPRTGDKEENNA